jgi:hypothetical protein
VILNKLDPVSWKSAVAAFSPAAPRVRVADLIIGDTTASRGDTTNKTITVIGPDDVIGSDAVMLQAPIAGSHLWVVDNIPVEAWVGANCIGGL